MYKEANAKEPLRVAQIIGKMWAGGVETVVFNYYREMDHNKVQFDFYYDADSTVKPPKDIVAMGARFYKLPPYQRLWEYMPKLKKYLINNNYSIIHSHLNTISVFPLFVAWILKIPVRIAHNHSVLGGNEWKRNCFKLILKQFSKFFATHYFACSEKAGRWLFGNKSFDKGQVLIVNNAINFDKFIISEKTISSIQNKLLLKNKIVIGHVGRFTYAKNHIKLLNIFNEIYKKNNNACLLLVGDGELHNNIIEKVKELGLTGQVICTGKVSDPEVYYPLMDLLILPSYFEGFSIVSIEAQISGIPVLVSDVVSKEVCISNACKYMDLKEDDKKWAKQAYNMIGMKVKLFPECYKYDIKKCAPKLQGWYLKHGKKRND